MIEKAARATFFAWRKDFDESGFEDKGARTYEELSDSERLFACKAAKATIQAIREPSEEMLQAGPGNPYMDKDVWAKMIDAALKE